MSLLLLALVFRLYADTCLPKKLISDDDYEYNYIALNIGKAFKGAALDDRQQFVLATASRGWLYPLFIAGVYKTFSPRVGFVLAVQSLLGVFTCLLIYLLAKGVFNQKTARLSAFLAAIYPGFLFYSTVLYQETTSLFLIVLLAYLIHLAISQNKVWLYFIAGMLVVFISFYRSGFILFIFPTTSIFLFVLWRHYKKQLMRFALAFFVGAVCMFMFYTALTYRISGSFTLNRPPSAWIFYETLHRDGWLTDTFAPSYSPELQQAAEDSGLLFPEGIQFDKISDRVYLKAGLMLILKDPLNIVSQLIKRNHRMWSYVATYPGKWHSKKVFIQQGFHRILILLGLCGLVLSFPFWRSTWFFYILFFYSIVIYTPIIGIPRYAILSMPFIIILASYVLTLLSESLSTSVRLRRKIIALLATALAAAVVYHYGISFLLFLFPKGSADLCHYIQIAIMNLLIIISAGVLYQALINNRKSIKINFIAVAVPATVLILFFNNDALSSRTWHEWEVWLKSSDQKIKQMIVLPDNFDIHQYKRATLMIDMFPDKGRDYDFNIIVNGQIVKSYQAGLKAREHKFDYNVQGLYKKFFFDSYKLRQEHFRQWYEINIPLDLLASGSKVIIECGLKKGNDSNLDYVIVFGDYSSGLNRNVFEGPCFPISEQDTSLAKIMPYSGDNRFERLTTLHSTATTSEYYKNASWQSKDLSDHYGIQSGVYRIRIQLQGKDGSQTIL